MSFRMLQPSSFVFCPLSSVLPRNQKPRNQKPRNQKLRNQNPEISCSFLAASGGNLLDAVQGKQAMPCLTRKVVPAAERALIREQIQVLLTFQVYSLFSCGVETGEAAFAQACAIDVVSIRIPCPQGETSLDRVQVPVFKIFPETSLLTGNRPRYTVPAICIRVQHAAFCLVEKAESISSQKSAFRFSAHDDLAVSIRRLLGNLTRSFHNSEY